MVYLAVIWIRIGDEPGDLAGSGSGGITYLLVGSDDRASAPEGDRAVFGTEAQVPGRRADIAVVVHRSADGTVRVLAIPRDLVLFRTGRGPERLASMLQDGGGAGVADALCHSLGIGIDHLAIIEFDGLIGLVDAVGGVRVSPPFPLRDTSSRLLVDAGPAVVDGTTALAYIRARHVERWTGSEWQPDPMLSAQRSERAIEVLSGLGRRFDLRWTDPIGTHRKIWAATGAVSVDDGAGPADLSRLAEALQQLPQSGPEVLDTDLADGDVPLASLGPEAAPAIRQFLRDSKPASQCSVPALLAQP